MSLSLQQEPMWSSFIFDFYDILISRQDQHSSWFCGVRIREDLHNMPTTTARVRRTLILKHLRAFILFWILQMRLVFKKTFSPFSLSFTANSSQPANVSMLHLKNQSVLARLNHKHFCFWRECNNWHFFYLNVIILPMKNCFVTYFK